MKGPSNILAIVGAMVLLSSCSPPPIDISAERVRGQMVIRLSQDWGMVFSSRKAPCVREVSLNAPGTEGQDKAAWLIRAKGDVQCLQLPMVTAGVVPKGWQEVVPMTAIGGRTYTVRVSGIGGGEADIAF